MSPQEEIEKPPNISNPMDETQLDSAPESRSAPDADPRIENCHDTDAAISDSIDVGNDDAAANEVEQPPTGQIIDDRIDKESAILAIPGQPPSATFAQESSNAGLVAAVRGLEEALSRRLDSLQRSFDRELRAEATRERIVERLHSELQDYKQDLLLKVQRPIFMDLIQLHDDIGKMIEAPSISASETDRVSHLVMTLESIQTAIEDILYRQGVEPFSIEGCAFDPRQQRAVTTQPTTDPSVNKQIATRLRKGFRAGDKLIRPEIVTVFTYRSPT